MDVNTLYKIVSESILVVVKESEIDLDVEIDAYTNLLSIFDSMDIVALIMETESKLYSVLGRNVSLADEYTFDIQRSPFNTVESWLNFVNKQLHEV